MYESLNTMNHHCNFKLNSYQKNMVTTIICPDGEVRCS